MGGGRLAECLAHSDRHNFRNPRLSHGYPIEDFGGLHGLLVVGHQHELRYPAHLFDHVVETIDVGIVQRSIDFVQEAEGTRLR